MNQFSCIDHLSRELPCGKLALLCGTLSVVMFAAPSLRQAGVCPLIIAIAFDLAWLDERKHANQMLADAGRPRWSPAPSASTTGRSWSTVPSGVRTWATRLAQRATAGRAVITMTGNKGSFAVNCSNASQPFFCGIFKSNNTRSQSLTRCKASAPRVARTTEAPV